jgi:hypothetical protein
MVSDPHQLEDGNYDRPKGLCMEPNIPRQLEARRAGTSLRTVKQHTDARLVVRMIHVYFAVDVMIPQIILGTWYTFKYLQGTVAAVIVETRRHGACLFTARYTMNIVRS